MSIHHLKNIFKFLLGLIKTSTELWIYIPLSASQRFDFIELNLGIMFLDYFEELDKNQSYEIWSCRHFKDFF